MHAYCLEWLKDSLQPGSKVLDVGSGSGYLVAAFYEMVRQGESAPPSTLQTQVVGIEHIDQLMEKSIENLKKNYATELNTGQMKVVCGDGRQGYLPDAPYDVIHVGAATP